MTEAIMGQPKPELGSGKAVEALLDQVVERVRQGEEIVNAVEAQKIVARLKLDSTALTAWLYEHAEVMLADQIRGRTARMRRRAWEHRGATAFAKWREQFERDDEAMPR